MQITIPDDLEDGDEGDDVEAHLQRLDQFMPKYKKLIKKTGYSLKLEELADWSNKPFSDKQHPNSRFLFTANSQMLILTTSKPKIFEMMLWTDFLELCISKKCFMLCMKKVNELLDAAKIELREIPSSYRDMMASLEPMILLLVTKIFPEIKQKHMEEYVSLLANMSMITLLKAGLSKYICGHLENIMVTFGFENEYLMNLKIFYMSQLIPVLEQEKLVKILNYLEKADDKKRKQFMNFIFLRKPKLRQFILDYAYERDGDFYVLTDFAMKGDVEDVVKPVDFMLGKVDKLNGGSKVDEAVDEAKEEMIGNEEQKDAEPEDKNDGKAEEENDEEADEKEETPSEAETRTQTVETTVAAQAGDETKAQEDKFDSLTQEEKMEQLDTTLFQFFWFIYECCYRKRKKSGDITSKDYAFHVFSKLIQENTIKPFIQINTINFLKCLKLLLEKDLGLELSRMTEKLPKIDLENYEGEGILDMEKTNPYLVYLFDMVYRLIDPSQQRYYFVLMASISLQNYKQIKISQDYTHTILVKLIENFDEFIKDDVLNLNEDDMIIQQ
jgi:hypothetical protein